jgi:hypothetical protein
MLTNQARQANIFHIRSRTHQLIAYHQMALYKSPILSAASGSIGGLTFQKSRAGAVLKHRTVRVNRDTPRQQNARNSLKVASSSWTNVLTQGQRDGWTAFANANPIPNSLGAFIQLTGLQMWNRFATPYFMQTSDPWADGDPPEVGPFLPAPVLSGPYYIFGSGQLNIPYETYATTGGAGLAFATISAPVSLTKNSSQASSAACTAQSVPQDPTAQNLTYNDPYAEQGLSRREASPITISFYIMNPTALNMTSPATATIYVD